MARGRGLDQGGAKHFSSEFIMKAILKFLMPIIRFFCRKPNYLLKDWESILFSKDQTCRVILTKTDWCLSNLGIKGFWKHAGIFDGNTVLEAKTKDGFVATPYYNFLSNKDHYIILELKNITEAQKKAIIKTARSLLGTPYDTGFKDGEEEVYCSEAVYFSIAKHVPSFKFDYGRIIEPQELYNLDKFRVIRRVHRR